MLPIGTMISLGYTILQNKDKIAEAVKALGPLLKLIPPDLFQNLGQPDVGGVGEKPRPEFTTKWIQDTLNKLGADPKVEVDGRYGKATREAVTAYQQKNSLEVDGWAGFETTAHMWNAIQPK
jgi:hypothetical protein